MAATEDVLAMAFLNTARQYHEAAALMFAAHNEKTKAERYTLQEPTYFLFLHTVELALKAFLRAHNLPIHGTERMSHGLTELYEECRSLGLVIGSEDRFSIGNIVGLFGIGQHVSRLSLLHSQIAYHARLRVDARSSCSINGSGG
jgi:hypothetical protein